MNDTNEQVLTFIHQFTNNGRKDQVIDTFTEGCCYWFAKILSIRFHKYKTIIVYDETICHFGCKIGNKVYDITGEVTDQYDWVHWNSIADELMKDRIIRDCIMF